MESELSRRNFLRLSAGASALAANGLKGFAGAGAASEAPVPMDPKEPDRLFSPGLKGARVEHLQRRGLRKARVRHLLSHQA